MPTFHERLMELELMFGYWRSGSGTRRTSPGAERSLCSSALASMSICHRLRGIRSQNVDNLRPRSNVTMSFEMQHDTLYELAITMLVLSVIVSEDMPDFDLDI